MTAPRVEVRGADEVARGFDTFARSLDTMTEAHRAVVAGLLPQVAARTPVSTGRLARSWGVDARPEAGTIVSAAEYAPPVEYGVPARGIMPAAMVRSTLEDSERAIVARYEDELAKLAERAGFRVVRS